MKKNLPWLVAAVLCVFSASCTKTNTDLSFSLIATNIDIAHKGGSYNIYYYLTGAEYGVYPYCIANVSWITSMDVRTDGTIKINVEENEDEESRTGTITVYYSYSGGTTSAEMTVRQAGAGRGADFTLDDILGSYTATGYQLESTGDVTLTSWTLNILPNYDQYVYIDGLLPLTEGKYAENNSNRYSATAYLSDDSEIIVKSCMTSASMSSDYGDYYIGYTPCYLYSLTNGMFYYDDTFPSLTFSYHTTTDTWEADYGMLCVGSTDSSDIKYLYLNFDVVIPPFTLTKN